MNFPALSLKGRALRLLSGREYSRQELTQKLRTHETAEGELAAILDDLEAKGFIDAQRVVDSVVHRRSAKLGVMRVRQELQSKGLPPDAVQAAVAQLQGTELARAQEVWRKKFGVGRSTAKTVGRCDAASALADRAKQMRFLASRGFSGDVIGRVLARGNTENHDDQNGCHDGEPVDWDGG
jgi:regulatory protein